jgi:hypothetical protein
MRCIDCPVTIVTRVLGALTARKGEREFIRERGTAGGKDESRGESQKGLRRY